MKPQRRSSLWALALLPLLLLAYLLLQRSGATAQAPGAEPHAGRQNAATAPRANDAAPTAARDGAARSHAAASAIHHEAGDRRQERSAAANTSSSAALPAVQADAALSLADALQHGDARSPPIARDSAPQEAATPAELADPVAYRRYENRQQARLYRAYEREAAIALSDMQRDLQRARAQNLPPELIAEGEEKARMLQQTLEAVRNGEMR
ncbi:hypothetical protein DFR29_103184 [Tahibacter aquaticus]|uniref:Uncharacterized protein n=1 Tax=Tahibacter aquaticus TaxID=520092 RepID=A0A4R6Z4N9_9GAMM|nr:hypothetical protein [Tahibacter aquaticus]TDR46648.1 hypothetical protein DFR29_103184 [Tahibacter aquaticus]